MFKNQRLLISALLLPVVFSVRSLAEETAKKGRCDDHSFVEQVLRRPHLSPTDYFSVNPTGKKIAYVLTSPLEQHYPSQRSYLENGMPLAELGMRLTISDTGTKQSVDICPQKVSCFRPAWSPNGQEIAYYSDESGSIGIWVTDLKSGKRRALISTRVKVAFVPGDEPIWSPDEKTVFVMTRSEENAKKLAEMASEDSDAVRVFSYRSNLFTDSAKSAKPDGRQDFYQSQFSGSIVAIDISSGGVKTIVSGERHPSPAFFRLSPSGKWISYLTVPQSVGHGQAVSDLYAVHTSGGEPVLLAQGLPESALAEALERTYRWNPKKDQLVYVKGGKLWSVDLNSGLTPSSASISNVNDATDFPLYFDSSGNHLLVGQTLKSKTSAHRSVVASWVSLNGNTPKNFEITTSHQETIRSFILNNDSTLWSSGALDFLVQAVDGDKIKVSGFPYENGARRILFEKRGALTLSPGSGRSGDIIALFEDVNTPQNLFRFDERMKRQEQITALATRSESPLNIKSMRLSSTIKVRGRSKSLDTLLLFPSGAKNLPTIVVGYPGLDYAQFGGLLGGGDIAYTVPGEIFLHCGYALAFVDLPAEDQNQKSEPVQWLKTILLPQISAVAKSEIVDPKRMALIGHSAGAEMVATALLFTHKFKAAIAIAGAYNSASSYGHLTKEGISPGVDSAKRRLIAPPWSDHDWYFRNSPYLQADKIDTSLLLLGGTNDPIVPFSQSGEMFSVLRALGKTVELAAYPNEEHMPTQWTLAHRDDVVEKVLAFLNEAFQ
jgi:dipeptidyl aminopeptidase/acylaminoacyl peptidase